MKAGGLIQRFGSALNLIVHLHMLILDGVYTLEQNGPRFHRVGAPNAQTLERLLNRLIHRIVRRLTLKNPALAWTDPTPKPFTANRGVFAPSSPMRRAIVPKPANLR